MPSGNKASSLYFYIASLYCAQIWGTAAKNKVENIKVVRNERICGITHSPWYRSNAE